MANYGTLGVATVFAALGLLLVAIGFATDHWIDTSVNREDLAAVVSQVGVCVCVCVRAPKGYKHRIAHFSFRKPKTFRDLLAISLRFILQIFNAAVSCTITNHPLGVVAGVGIGVVVVVVDKS